MSRDALITVALDHHKAGRLIEADRFYQALLSIDPDDADALHLSGVVALSQGDPVRSIGLIRRALANRDDATFRLSLGAALVAAGHHAEAAAAIETTLAAGSDQPHTHDSLGGLYIILQRWADAEAACRRAIANHPNPAPAWHNLGTACVHQGRPEEAVEAFTQSLAVRPDNPDTLSGLGNALRSLGRLDEAQAALHRLRALRPAEYRPANDLALALEALGRYPEALALIDEAARLAPDNASDSAAIRFNRALMLLRTGRYAEGWPGFEARLEIHPPDPHYAHLAAIPRWTGEPLDGRTILLTHEQGFGDIVQFARYATLLADYATRVIIDVQPPLRRLFATLPGVARHAEPGDVPDFHCPIMSLPGLLGSTWETIPAAVPYLHPEPEAAQRWAAHIGTGEGGLRVGFVWAGNPGHAAYRLRSIPFPALAPLLGIPGIRCFSLQVGDQATHAAIDPALEDLSPALTDFAETAAAITSLDLVIAIDTAVAHLAGALGRPVWLLLHAAADWRWFTDPESSAWYPTMRLYRQDSSGTWPPVLARVATDLRAMSEKALGGLGCWSSTR